MGSARRRCSMSLPGSLPRTRVLFFFSSRRRHTRFDCDWSSDVCSSDLPVGQGLPQSPSTLEALRGGYPRRSEEHTSELQSQSNLVCRLLLEKKKQKIPLFFRSLPIRALRSFEKISPCGHRRADWHVVVY